MKEEAQTFLKYFTWRRKETIAEDFLTIMNKTSYKNPSEFSPQKNCDDTYMAKVDSEMIDVVASDTKKMSDTYNNIILVTGCVKTVAGSKWINDLIILMSWRTMQGIMIEKSDRIFKFLWR